MGMVPVPSGMLLCLIRFCCCWMTGSVRGSSLLLGVLGELEIDFAAVGTGVSGRVDLEIC